MEASVPINSEHISTSVSQHAEFVRFQVEGKYTGSFPVFPGRTYELRVASPSTGARWGLRLRSFQDVKNATIYQHSLNETGLETEILRLGKSYRKLTSDVWTVAAGNWNTRADVLTLGSDFLDELPDVAGLKKYSDEFLFPDPIRFEPPAGGEIVLTDMDTGETSVLPSPFYLEPSSREDVFRIDDIQIGIDFHWDHRESIPFRGALNVFVDGNLLTAVNEIEIPFYLASLLGSEMRPDWHLHALAAQAVAAHSTILATRGRHHHAEGFDLCHDDHCQCYRGKSRESSLAWKALTLTEYSFMTFGNSLADTRYAKTCGGMSDNYAVAWEDWKIPYMVPVPCVHSGSIADSTENHHFDLQTDEQFVKYQNAPSVTAACNPFTHPYPASSKEMEGLFVWEERLTQNEIQELIQNRIGLKVGKIEQIEPLKRGKSGRIIFIRIHAEHKTFSLGKELKIRRLLSETHLPSSAFVVQKEGSDFVFKGLGWGHGVGMCQLGANALAEEGWDWKDILLHYYPGCEIQRG
ncbi:SpoIID/LytB domain-containing protein [bacterium]|nr:SpoIID/LytB domain-containing protein [bacterium]